MSTLKDLILTPKIAVKKSALKDIYIFFFLKKERKKSTFRGLIRDEMFLFFCFFFFRIKALKKALKTLKGLKKNLKKDF